MLVTASAQCLELIDLWKNRQTFHSSRHYDVAEITRIDQRLMFHVRAIQSVNLSDNILQGEFSSDEIVTIKLLCYPAIRASLVLEYLVDELSHLTIFKVFSWLPINQTKNLLIDLLDDSTNFWSRKLAVDTFSFHRVEPPQYLIRYQQEKQPLVIAAWTQLIAMFGKEKIGFALNKDEPIDNSEYQVYRGFAKQFSVEKLHPLDWLEQLIENDCLSEDWTVLIFIQLNKQEVILALNSMINHGEKYSRLMIVGIAASGYLRYLDWLLEMLDDNELAITGLHSICEMLGNKPGEILSFTETATVDDPHDLAKIKSYRSKIEVWWKSNQQNYDLESRYLLGKTLDNTNLSQLYQTSSQWMRRRIAMELYLTDGLQVMVNHNLNRAVF